MTQLVLERCFDPPIDREFVIEQAKAGAWCMQQYSVAWHGSLLSLDGHRLICRFESMDAESIRQALGKLDADMRVSWPATVHDAPEPGPANVIVERSFDEPVTLDDIQAQEDANQWCLDTHGVKFVQTLFSRDQKRMLCLYSAADADAVAEAQRKAEMPVDRIWPFARISMADIAAGAP
jgi:hypothetical protein